MPIVILFFATYNPDTVIDANAARVINAMTKTYIDIPDDVKEINMCKAIEDLINDSKAEGMAEGISKGKNEGRHEGIIETLTGLVNDNLLSIKDAAARVNMTEEAFTAMLRK